MSAKSAFFGIFQKIMVICCTMFFGFTNAFSANLPSGYTELEYIQGDGNAYIKTDVVPTSNTGMKIMFVYGSSGSAAIAGTYDGNAPRQDTFFISTGAGTITGTTQNLIAHRGTVIPAQGETETTETPVAGKTYTANINYKNSGTMGFEGFAQRNVGTANVLTNKVLLFARLNYNNNNITASASKIKYVEFTEGNNVSHKLVPAKNASGVVGMYDTVNDVFYTNQGTGTFTAGPVVLNPCRNLFDANSVLNVHHTCAVVGTFPAAGTSENGRTYFMQVEPNTTYTVSMTTAGDRLCIFGINSVVNPDDYTSDSRLAFDRTVFCATTDIPRQKTFTTNANERMVAIYYALNTIPTYFQIEQGSTATAYVPYNASCHNPNGIKIATTAYNAARFNPVKTDLDSAVATIREIVTKTINQTAAIASLQADKQTRPEDACPAGKKCLLVETEENGVIVPHWFPIIEAPE